MSERNESKGTGKQPGSSSSGKGSPEREKRNQALERAMAQIERQYGKGAVMRLGADQRQEIEAISTGSISLDMALGVGGVPRGRVVEIFGPEASGKTTLGLHIIASAQKAGGICAFVDAEHAFDMGYASRLGVRLDDLLVSQPDSGEQALDVVADEAGDHERAAHAHGLEVR